MQLNNYLLPETQTFSQSFCVSNLFSFPSQPPYQNLAQLAVSGSKYHFRTKFLQVPSFFFNWQISVTANQETKNHYITLCKKKTLYTNVLHHKVHTGSVEHDDKAFPVTMSMLSSGTVIHITHIFSSIQFYYIQQHAELKENKGWSVVKERNHPQSNTS